jgi:ATP-dependent RNA helicase RhlE
VGYINPTPIQEKAIPVALEGRDVLGLAQTGTGKTAGFLLPILQRLMNGKLRSPKALILSPTRELAEQTYEASLDLAKFTKIHSTVVYGGVNKARQIRALKRGIEILIACPGRLLDHISEGNIDLSGIEVLVLDEADTMCDMGFLPDIKRILTFLPKERQTLFFAATMPNEIRKLSNTILNNPETIQIGKIEPAKTVSHVLYPTTEFLRKPMLLELLKTTPTGRVIIFSRTKYRVRRLESDLLKAKFRVAGLQGNMSQNKRTQAINGFKNGKFDILVATDVASRGIDVSEISHVINFDIPNTVDSYIHRIGRTGRAESTGEAISFSTPEDESMINKIEHTLGSKIKRCKLEDFDYKGFGKKVKSFSSTKPNNRSTFQRRRPRRTHKPSNN